MSLISQALQKTDENKTKNEPEKMQEEVQPQVAPQMQAPIIPVTTAPRKAPLSEEEVKRIHMTDQEIEKELNKVKNREDKRKLVAWLPWFFLAAVVGAGAAYYLSYQNQNVDRSFFNPLGEEAFMAERSSRIDSASVESRLEKEIATQEIREDEAYMNSVESAEVGSIVTEEPVAAMNGPAPISSTSKFILTGITLIDNEFTAIINNEIVGAGDMVQREAYVRDIQKDYALVEFEGESFVLNMN